MRVVRVLCCQYVLLRMEADACFCSCEGSGKRNLLAEPTLLKRVMRVTMKSKRSAKRKKKAVPVSAGAGKRKSLEARAKQIAHDAHAVHAWLEPILKASAAAEKAYAFKQRLKEWNHICDKVVAKRAHEDPNLESRVTSQKVLQMLQGFGLLGYLTLRFQTLYLIFFSYLMPHEIRAPEVTSRIDVFARLYSIQVDAKAIHCRFCHK